MLLRLGLLLLRLFLLLLSLLLGLTLLLLALLGLSLLYLALLRLSLLLPLAALSLLHLLLCHHRGVVIPGVTDIREHRRDFMAGEIVAECRHLPAAMHHGQNCSGGVLRSDQFIAVEGRVNIGARAAQLVAGGATGPIDPFTLINERSLLGLLPAFARPHFPFRR